MSVYAMPKPVSPWTGLECFAFRWIGQAPTSCDGCGQPYWDHTHVEVQHANGKLGWSLRKVISDENRADVKRKWNPTLIAREAGQ